MNSWILFAFIACVFTTLEVLAMKKISLFGDQISVDDSFLAAIIAIGFICFLIFISKRGSLRSRIKSLWSLNALVILVYGLFMLTHRYFFIKSVDVSPNPGYSHLIVNFNVILTLIFSYILFRSKINRMTLLGIVLSIIGITIVATHY